MKFLIFYILIFCVIASCQKEFGNGGSRAIDGLAIFSLTTPSGNCTNAVVNGTYATGLSLTVANTIAIKVIVTSIGAYTINTNTLNGISFTVSGVFTSTGEQTIHLFGKGTPITDGNFKFTIGNNGCVFSITTIPTSKGNAMFTYHGSPNSCTNITKGGVYSVGIPLTSLNKIIIDVNVIVPGFYTITTELINGFSFSGSGKLETIGFGTVTIVATGTPLASGTFIFTPSGNGCRIPVSVNP